MKVSGKVIEYERYNSKSEEKLNDPHINFGSSGSKAFPVYLQSPYIFFEEYAARVIRSEMKVLDLCCGDGVHTVSLAKSNANVTAIDIAENSIKIAKLRALHERLNNIEFLVADVEKLNFGEQKFDIIILVGSLSYLDLTSLISQIKKYLKPEGKFICVDSLDHNLIYRTNRLIHYLCSRRSWSTLVRMPWLR
jgi:ubiquinone/menaquinone biosynthesis C-methylase UbiE